MYFYIQTTNKKMNKSKILLVFFLSYFWSFAANAQNEDLRLSMSQAVKHAVSHNRSLQNSSLEVKKAQAKSWQVLAGMLPHVNAKFDYQNFCGYEMSMMGFSIPMNPAGTLGITASMSVSAPQIVSTMLVKLAVEMADITVKRHEHQIASQVIKVYTSILAMEKTLDLLDSNLLNMKKLQEITENVVKAGAGEQTDADKLSVQVSSMQNTISSTRRTLEMLYNSLRLQLGSDVSVSLILTDKLDDILDLDGAKKILSTDFDIEKNYDYQLLRQNLTLADKQVVMAESGYLPSLTAFYQYSYKTYFGASEGMNMTPPNLVGLSLSLPIFSSGLRSHQVSEAKISKEILDNTFASTRDALLVQNKQLRYNLTTAFEDYENQQRNIDVSHRVFASISLKYEYGTASTLDVTNASSSLIMAQSNYVQSVLNLMNAKTELEVLLGIKSFNN